MIVYLETSALLSWLFGESAGRRVRTAINRAESVVASVLTITESRRALVRAERAGTITSATGQRLRGVLARAQLGWMSMEVSAEVRARAEEPFPVEPVRTLDALHLATALSFARVYADLEVLSLDQRVNDNACALGLVAAFA